MILAHRCDELAERFKVHVQSVDLCSPRISCSSPTGGATTGLRPSTQRREVARVEPKTRWPASSRRQTWGHWNDDCGRMKLTGFGPRRLNELLLTSPVPSHIERSPRATIGAGSRWR